MFPHCKITPCPKWSYSIFTVLFLPHYFLESFFSVLSYSFSHKAGIKYSPDTFPFMIIIPSDSNQTLAFANIQGEKTGFLLYIAMPLLITSDEPSH